MIFMLVGALASGILARVSYLSQRPVLFSLRPNVKRRMDATLDATVVSFGLMALGASIALFGWAVTFAALLLGHAVIGPILVNGNGFAFFHRIRNLISLVSFGSSLALCGMYLDMT